MGLQTINGKTYYFDELYGYMISNEVKEIKQGNTTVLAYFDSHGVMSTSTWVQQGNNWLYFKDGKYVTGWQTINGKTYYFNPNNNQMVIGKLSLDGKTYCFDEHGVLVTNGWVQVGILKEWCYLENGNLASGWKTINGKTYYFDYYNYMVTGSQSIDGEKYYFKEDGSLIVNGWYTGLGGWAYIENYREFAHGFKEINGNTYYFTMDSGIMQTGDVVIDGKHYLFESNGVLSKSQSIWIESGYHKYYYLNGEKVVSRWLNIDGYDYYFLDNGDYAIGNHMAKDPQTGEYKFYGFDMDGHLIKNGWGRIPGGEEYDFWFYTENGVIVIGWKQINGKWYYFTEDFGGLMYMNDTQSIEASDGNTYLYAFDVHGVMATGWCKIEDTWYYAESNGRLVTSSFKTINGNVYYFDANGKMATGVKGISDGIGLVDYVFQDNGIALNGWLESNGDWYYYNNGLAASGLTTISNKQYFFDVSSHIMQKGVVFITSENRNGFFDDHGVRVCDGWFLSGGEWYYIKDDKAVKGWQTINGNRYYFSRLTYMMYQGPHTINSIRYCFGTNGILVTNNWFSYDGIWYYANQEGMALIGWQKINDNWYYFDSDGAMISNRVFTVPASDNPNATYAFDSHGVMMKGWAQIDGVWYYAESNGRLVKNSFKVINGNTYYFDGKYQMVIGTRIIGGKAYTFAANGILQN